MLAEHKLPPLEVSWLQRDVLLFANSIGVTADELHFLYVSLPLVPVWTLTRSYVFSTPGTPSPIHGVSDIPSDLAYVFTSTRGRSTCEINDFLTSPAFKRTDQEIIEFMAATLPTPLWEPQL